MTRAFTLTALSGGLALAAACGSTVVSPITTGGAGGTTSSSSSTSGLASSGSPPGSSSSTGGPGGGSTGGPITTLANVGAGVFVQSIAAGATDVFWSTRAPSSAIWKVAKMGGPATPVVTGADDYWAVLADDTTVYWSQDGGSSGTGVYRMPQSGGTPTLLAPGGSRWMALDATSVYWTEWNASMGSIMKVSIAGGAPTTVVSLGSSGTPDAIAVDTANVYWHDLIANAVYSAPLAGGPIGTLTSHDPSPGQSLVAGGGWVYWPTTVNQTGIAGEPATGGAIGVWPDMDAQYLAIDAFAVYWTDHMGGIKKAPIGGQAVTQVASFGWQMESGSPSAITVDQTNVYWGGEQANAIYAAPKAL